VTGECAVCGVPHDAALHQAVLRVRQRLRLRLLHILQPRPEARASTFPTGMVGVRELRSPAAKRKAAQK
jgi:hypothetical protein